MDTNVQRFSAGLRSMERSGSATGQTAEEPEERVGRLEYLLVRAELVSRSLSFLSESQRAETKSFGSLGVY